MSRASPPLSARRKRTQPLGGGFGCDVALWCAEHFESHHEFANGRRTKKRGIEVSVKVPFGMGRLVGGSLMKSHRVRKGNFEYAIVGRSYVLQVAADFRHFCG